MQEIFIGEAIKRRRLELGLTQEELCEGICEPITISRLENGRQTPSRSRVNAIMERLDMPGDRYYALVSQREQEIELLHKQLVSYHSQFRYASQEEKVRIREKGWEIHKELEKIIDEDDRISRQRILCSEAILGKEDGPYSPEEQKKMLLQAIQMTTPGFDLEEIGKNLYTQDEIRMINQLAAVDIQAGEHKEAIHILSELYSYVKEHFKNIEQSNGMITMIAGNLANELDKTGRYREAIQLAEEGKRICIEKGCYFILPGFLAVMAECWHFLDDEEKSKDLYRQVYYLYKATGNEVEMKKVRKEAKEYLDLELEE